MNKLILDKLNVVLLNLQLNKKVVYTHPLPILGQNLCKIIL